MTDPLAGSDLSRRSLVKTAATAAAVGTGLAAAGPATTARAAAVPEQAPPAHGPLAGQDDPGTRVLVRLLDARAGTLELYTEHGHRTLTDRALAARLARLGR